MKNFAADLESPEIMAVCQLERQEGFVTDINYISPYIRVAIDSVINPPWKLDERVIFDYELLYIKDGEVEITIEDRCYKGKQGDIFLFKPKISHSIRLTGDSCFRQPHIHFDLFYRPDSPQVKVSFKPQDKMSREELGQFREDAASGPLMSLPEKIFVRNIRYFEEMLFDIIKENKARSPYFELNMKGLFLRLWTYLLRENDFLSNPSVFSRLGELENIKGYLNGNIDREVTLDELSRAFNISRFHLSRLFKRVYGVTPIRYNQMLRIEKARELIQYGNLSLTDISDALGFSSINAFSRAFRNMEGVPPSFYRKR